MNTLEKHLITSKECAILAEYYVKSNYAEINAKRPSSKPDSKMYSIDLSVLQDYLQLISDEMEKKGVKNKGVQVSLGKYPENSKDVKLKPEYLGYQMIFFSPVDLSQSESEDGSSAKEANPSFKLDDISNLNYMNITPPF